MMFFLFHHKSSEANFVVKILDHLTTSAVNKYFSIQWSVSGAQTHSTEGDLLEGIYKQVPTHEGYIYLYMMLAQYALHTAHNK